MTNDMMTMLFYIPEGRENAISRSELRTAAGYSDRRMRNIIARLREEGYLICNDGCGYYITDDLDEIEKQYKQDTSRALSILKRRKHMRKILKANGRAV